MTARRSSRSAVVVAALLLAASALEGCQRSVAWSPAASVTPSDAGTVELAVTRIADGDTFTGTDPAGAKVKVRILSIDAPELAHNGTAAECGATQAAARLRELIFGQTVRVVADPRSDAVDRYGRRLGYVERDGRDVGLRLIEEGLVEAWYPSGEPRPDRYGVYVGIERSARAKRTGSWATCPELGR